MTATRSLRPVTRVEPPAAWHRRPRANARRRIWLLVALAGLGWSGARAGFDLSSLVAAAGWRQVGNFFSSMVTPDLSDDLLRLVLSETAVTISYALLGTALALFIGLVGGVLVAERTGLPHRGRWGRWGWRAGRTLLALPRALHEVVFGLLLVSVLGLDPLVAILAIGLPYGAVTAKVFAELLDEAPSDAERALRSSGAGGLAALVFGRAPFALGDLLSYSFYRLECAIRSAAVLGIVGAGGLGVQLRLSFESERYDEVWTMLWALILLSAGAGLWSSAVRRRATTGGHRANSQRGKAPPRDRLLLTSIGGFAVALPVAWWWVGADLRTLWSERTRRLARELVGDSWPPSLGPEGAGGLVSDMADTVALAVLALALAAVFSSGVAFLARRPSGRTRSHRPSTWVRSGAGLLSRFVLLVARTVPPPLWAFLAVFVFLPGLWAGAVALAVYNLGVLGRLQAEVVENLDHRPGERLRAAGANPLGALLYATIPAVSGRFVALSLYRWEVAARDTVMVGVVGAGGLGQRLQEQTSAFDFNGILATLLALVVVTVAVDLASAGLRRSLR